MMRKVFIILFFLICCTPVVQMLFALPDAKPVAQKFAAEPSADPISSPFQWTAQAKAWFNDHFGFRSFLIRLKEQTDYSLFHTSAHVHIGKHDQLYLRQVMDVEQPEYQKMLQEHEDQILHNVGRLADAMHERGLTFFIMVNLLSNRFLTDDLPSSVPHALSNPKIEEFIERLKELPNVHVLDAQPILNKLSMDHQIFYKTDFHWTFYAGSMTARMFVDKVSALENRPPTVWPSEEPQEKIVHDHIGGMSMNTPLLFGQPREERAEVVQDIYFDREPPTSIANLYGLLAPVRPPNNKFLKPLFILGDSYLDAFIAEGANNMFNNYYEMGFPIEARNDTISHAVLVIPPDTKYFMLQGIETQKNFWSNLLNDSDIDQAIAYLRARNFKP
jgi:hypothetical protein